MCLGRIQASWKEQNRPIYERYRYCFHRGDKRVMVRVMVRVIVGVKVRVKVVIVVGGVVEVEVVH